MEGGMANRSHCRHTPHTERTRRQSVFMLTKSVSRMGHDSVMVLGFWEYYIKSQTFRAFIQHTTTHAPNMNCVHCYYVAYARLIGIQSENHHSRMRAVMHIQNRYCDCIKMLSILFAAFARSGKHEQYMYARHSESHVHRHKLINSLTYARINNCQRNRHCRTRTFFARINPEIRC